MGMGFEPTFLCTIPEIYIVFKKSFSVLQYYRKLEHSLDFYLSGRLPKREIDVNSCQHVVSLISLSNFIKMYKVVSELRV